MAVLAILLLVCASLVAFISGDHITSGDPVFNEHAVWISLGGEKYTCADACHLLKGSCDATQYTLLTRKLFISKILPYAVSVKHCGGLDWKDPSTTLDDVKRRCELLTASPVAHILFDDVNDDRNLDDDDDTPGDGATDPLVTQTFFLMKKQSCYERGNFDDTTDGGYGDSGHRVLCPCIYDATHTPTESPTQAPTPVPFQAPTRHPTVNHPAIALEKKFAKIDSKLEKDKMQDQKQNGKR